MTERKKGTEGRDDGLQSEDQNGGEDTKPKHVNGFCDLGACENLANWAYRDDDIYIEVCSYHAENLESQFDSGYERVERDSPYRGSDPETTKHRCGGELEIYETLDGNEFRVCDGCDYAMLLEHTGDKSMRVHHTGNE